VPLAPLVLHEITYRELTGPQGSRLRQIASAGAPAQRIARAIQWLKDHFADPLRIESLAKHVRMSPSAFHLHFKGVTALSPLQYQKRLRLQSVPGSEPCQTTWVAGRRVPGTMSVTFPAGRPLGGQAHELPSPVSRR
jgi:hypothetical protein